MRACCVAILVVKGFPNSRFFSGHTNRTNNVYLLNWAHGHKRPNPMNFRSDFTATVKHARGKHGKMSFLQLLNHHLTPLGFVL